MFETEANFQLINIYILGGPWPLDWCYIEKCWQYVPVCQYQNYVKWSTEVRESKIFGLSTHLSVIGPVA